MTEIALSQSGEVALCALEELADPGSTVLTLRHADDSLSRVMLLRKGAKVYHLLCSRGVADKKIRVVGLYSSTEELARGIAAGVTAYAAAGQVLGTVEFNLGIKVDQPPVDPS